MKYVSLVLGLLTAGCVGVPDNIEPVGDFDAQRYLGTWYEVARFDHWFERGLENVTAEYSMRGDGGIRVVNRGFDPGKSRWKEAEGKAYFVGDKNTGHLKVSFFGPFYSSYIIIELDSEDYSYALVTSTKKSFLWILSRTSVMEKDTLERLIAKARSLGFETENLIYVNQNTR